MQQLHHGSRLYRLIQRVLGEAGRRGGRGTGGEGEVQVLKGGRIRVEKGAGTRAKRGGGGRLVRGGERADTYQAMGQGLTWQGAICARGLRPEHTPIDSVLIPGRNQTTFSRQQILSS